MKNKYLTRPRLVVAALGLGTVLAIFQPALTRSADASLYSWPAIGLRVCLYLSIGLVAAGLVFCLPKIARWFVRYGLKWLLRAMAVMFVLILMFYAEEDWRGKNAWDKYRQAEEAKGENFDFASFIPPPVPDEQNFALTPIVASCYSRYLDKNGHRLQSENTNVVNRLDIRTSSLQEDLYLNNTNSLGNWQASEVINLTGWQRYYREPADTNCFPSLTNQFPMTPKPQTPAVDVLTALSKYISVLDELTQAANHYGKSRFPINYDSASPTALVQPHLYYFEDCAEVLKLRMAAELADHQSGKALADIELILRLSDSIQNEPGFYSQLDRLRLVSDIFQPIWEGTDEHNWSDSQLAELEQDMGGLNLLTEYTFAMRSERARNIAIIEFMRRHRTSAWNCIPMITYLGRDLTYEPPDDPESPEPQPFIARLIPWLLPNGWFYSSEMAIGRIYQPSLPATGNDERALILAAQSAESVKENERRHRSRWNYVALTVCPYFGRLAQLFIEEQASLNLARVACALERHSLAYGKYPENLNILAPQFIESVPHDIINGQPLHYRRTSDGRFQLYSVGWSGKDNRGILGRYSDGEFDFKKGDLVWQYPPSNHP